MSIALRSTLIGGCTRAGIEIANAIVYNGGHFEGKDILNAFAEGFIFGSLLGFSGAFSAAYITANIIGIALCGTGAWSATQGFWEAYAKKDSYGMILNGTGAVLSTYGMLQFSYNGARLTQAKYGEDCNNLVAKVKGIVKPKYENTGRPFQKGQSLGSIQEGVDPNTLISKKDLNSLDPLRIQDAVKFAGDQAIEVSRNGVIQQGHHRVADAIANGKAVDIVITTWGD